MAVMVLMDESSANYESRTGFCVHYAAKRGENWYLLRRLNIQKPELQQ